jgi:taurine transport system substrate-binding protein
VEENPELVADFLAITARMNERWNSGEHTAEMLPVIARDAGMGEEATADTLAGFVFPSVEDQLSATWLGGGTQDFLLEVANFFVETGNIPSARDSYEGAVNTGPLQMVQDGM